MISTVILFKDEIESIHRCLNSVAWCDDVVIVHDTHNTHFELRTPRPEVRVIRRPLDGDFSSQRTYGMRHTKHDWVLFVDADEELTIELAAFLEKFNPDDHMAGYTIPRVDVFWGKHIRNGEVYTVAHNGLLRLVHKDRGRWEGTVHERFVHTGKVDRISQSMLHYPHPSVASFLEHINSYSSMRAREIEDRPVWRLFGELLLYPPAKFFYTYVFKMGILDGAPGFIYSFMMAFHSFLVRAKAITKTYDI